MEKFAVAVLSILVSLNWAACAPLLVGNVPFNSVRTLPGSRLRTPADLECEVCKIMVDALQHLLLSNSTEDEVVDVITKLCIDLQIQDQNVCTLVVREFKVERTCGTSIIVSDLL